MPIMVQCEKCGKSLKAPDTLAGKRVKCPGCGGAISVPAAAPAMDLLDGLGEDDLLSGGGLSGGGLGDLDKLSQAVGKSLPAASASSRGADPLGPTPTAQAARKKDPRRMLIIGGSIGGAVLVVLLVVVVIFMFQGDSAPTTTVADGTPAAVPVSPPPPPPAAASQPAAPAQDLSGLFEAPQAPVAPAAPAGKPASPATGSGPAAATLSQPNQPQPVAPAQPGAPVALASASQPVPVAPAKVPAPAVNAPPPIQNHPPAFAGPPNPQQQANNEKAGREQAKNVRQSYVDLLSGAPEALVEQMRWAPAAKRPVLGLRWGISLPVPQMAKAGRPQPPKAADSEAAITQKIGPVGTKLLAALNERILHGDFGGQPGSVSDPAHQVTVLPGEDRGEVLAAARERGVDIVILLKLEFLASHGRKKKGKGAAGGAPQMSALLSARIVDVAAGTPGWTSEPLSNKNKTTAEKDAQDWTEDLFKQVDEFKLQPVPVLDAKPVDKRMGELEKKKPANPLPALIEVRYYQIKGLVPIERANGFFAQVLGEQGKLLTSDTAAERKQALEKMPKL